MASVSLLRRRRSCWPRAPGSRQLMAKLAQAGGVPPALRARSLALSARVLVPPQWGMVPAPHLAFRCRPRGGPVVTLESCGGPLPLEGAGVAGPAIARAATGAQLSSAQLSQFARAACFRSNVPLPFRIKDAGPYRIAVACRQFAACCHVQNRCPPASGSVKALCSTCGAPGGLQRGSSAFQSESQVGNATLQTAEPRAGEV